MPARPRSWTRPILLGLPIVWSTASACSSIIGLDEYRVAGEMSATGGSAGAMAAGGTTSGGTSTGGTSTAGASTGGTSMAGASTGGASPGTCDGCDDEIACTEDVCEDGVCSHVPNHTLCPDSGDVCAPNLCDVTEGCQVVDLDETDVVLVNATTSNGSFEQGVVPESGPWTYSSSQGLQLAYDCSNDPCTGVHANITASHGNRLLWLGGEHTHQDAVSQSLTLPATTTRLHVVADINFQSVNTAAGNQDTFEVWLRDAVDDSPLTALPLHRSTAADAQGSTAAWSTDVVLVDGADVSALAGQTVRVSFESETDASQFTDFFLDDIRITIVTCD